MTFISSSSFCSRISACFFPRGNKVFQEEVGELVNRIQAFKQYDRAITHIDKVRVFEKLDDILQKWQDKSTVPACIRTLEKTALAYRLRFPRKLPGNACQIEKLKKNIQKHDAVSFKRWAVKSGLNDRIYFKYPDFADFILSAHIHKSFVYFGEDKIKNHGQVGLFVEGKFTPWEALSKRFFIEEGKIYSKETEGKKRWIYVAEGLVCHDPLNWKTPVALMKLKTPPGKYLFQVVTSHIKPENQNITDRVFEGARHTWFRIITPEGSVYSFGMAFDPQEFNVLQPLSSVKGRIACPDAYEGCAEKRIETTFPIEKEHVLNIGEIIKRYNLDENVRFNFIKGNCAGFTQEVLRASGVGTIPKTTMTVSQILWKFFLPKHVRKIIKSLWAHTFACITPEFLAKGFSSLVNLVNSLILLPLTTLLGGWFLRAKKGVAPQAIEDAFPSESKRVADRNASLEENYFLSVFKQNGWNQEVDHLVRPLVGRLYNRLGDVFNPNTLTIEMTSRIAKWQLKQVCKTRVIEVSK